MMHCKLFNHCPSKITANSITNISVRVQECSLTSRYKASFLDNSFTQCVAGFWISKIPSVWWQYLHWQLSRWHKFYRGQYVLRRCVNFTIVGKMMGVWFMRQKEVCPRYKTKYRHKIKWIAGTLLLVAVPARHRTNCRHTYIMQTSWYRTSTDPALLSRRSLCVHVLFTEFVDRNYSFQVIALLCQLWANVLHLYDIFSCDSVVQFQYYLRQENPKAGTVRTRSK